MEIRLFALFLLLPLTISTSYSQEDDLMWEGHFVYMVHYGRNVAYSVVDEVEDGCMPRPENVEVAAEATLRRYDFEISDDSVSNFLLKPEIQIYAIGYEIGESGICAVSVRTTVMYPVISYAREQQVFFQADMLVGNVLMTGAKSEMQGRIESTARQHIEYLFTVMDRANDRFEKEYPEFMNWSGGDGSE